MHHTVAKPEKYTILPNYERYYSYHEETPNLTFNVDIVHNLDMPIQVSKNFQDVAAATILLVSLTYPR